MCQSVYTAQDDSTCFLGFHSGPRTSHDVIKHVWLVVQALGMYVVCCTISFYKSNEVCVAKFVARRPSHFFVVWVTKTSKNACHDNSGDNPREMGMSRGVTRVGNRASRRLLLFGST